MFDEPKTTQMAARLLATAGGQLDYINLMKMMYEADRDMLLTWGFPIAYDNWVSMDNGPVLSATWDVQKSASPGYWSRHITKQRFMVKLVLNPGYDLLSDAELDVIDRAYPKYAGLTSHQAALKSHELPEWVDPNGSSIPMTFEHILSKNGRTDLLDEVSENIQVHALLSSLK